MTNQCLQRGGTGPESQLAALVLRYKAGAVAPPRPLIFTHHSAQVLGSFGELPADSHLRLRDSLFALIKVYTASSKAISTTARPPGGGGGAQRRP